MKKAFDLLTELGIAYDFHDYKKQGIDAETVKTWLDQVGQDIILNKKGTTWKKLTEQEQQVALSSQEELIKALTTHTSLIKRPVIDQNGQYVIGFDEDKIKALKLTA